MASPSAHPDPILDSLNPAQRRAATADDGPLLIIAGAGTGKTQTLAHRVAHLIARGADSRRVLLLTFSRRAAFEMTRRAVRLLNRKPGQDAWLPWAGTFHAVANRLLRHHAQEAGLDPAFTLLDREDAADLLDRLRHDQGLARTDRRFPRKGILAFPRQYEPPATVVTIEQNYRSTAPILDAANAVIALATERYEKRLFSARPGGGRPALATVADELEQVEYVVTRVLERREAGVPLRQQAVLFRTAHHSDALRSSSGGATFHS